MAYVDKIVVEGTTYDLVPMESIKDLNGNQRFISGDMTKVGTTTSIGIKYNKWSLSGTHLMIVLAYEGQTENTTFSSGNLFKVNLPAWVINKIYPIKATLVLANNMICVGNDNVTQSIFLLKKIDNNIYISLDSDLTIPNRWSNGRLQFDLLIDND